MKELIVLVSLMSGICLALHIYNGEKINYFKILLDAIKTLISGWFITVTFCVAYQNSWIKGNLIQSEITYDEFAGIYAILTIMLIVLIITLKCFACSYNRDSQLTDLSVIVRKKKVGEGQIKEKTSELALQQLEIRSTHEAGHVVMAEALDVKVEEVTLVPYGNSGGHVRLGIGPILTSENLKKQVLILYAGLFAEKILLGSVSNGCMGAENSDLQLANKYLKQYILLTDKEISLTGLECEEKKVNKRMVQLSKEWGQLVEDTLEKYIQELREEKEELLNNYYVNENGRYA